MAIHWTLRRRIFAGYGIVLLLLLVLFAWAFLSLLHLGRASGAILSENYRSILAAEKMINAAERQDSAVLIYLLGNRDDGLAQFHVNRDEFVRWLKEAQDNITIEGEFQIVSDIDSAYHVFVDAFTAVQTPAPTTPQAGFSLYAARIFPTFLPVRELSARLHDLNQRAMVEASNSARNQATRALWSVGLLGLTALGLGLLFSFVLSRRLSRPLSDLSHAAARIAEGDYDVEVPALSADELGTLIGRFNVMSERLRSYRNLNVDRLMTEQKRSEAILRSISDGIVVFDADLGVLTLNPAAETALGLALEDVEGRPLADVISDTRIAQFVRDTVETGHPPTLSDADPHLVILREDINRHYQCVVTPVRSISGRLLGAVLLLHDVTLFKELDRLKSDFVATASHELRTPLTSISMSIGLLQERMADRLDERELALLNVAGEEVARLRELVSDLLDLSRIEAGRMDLTLEDAVSVRELIHRAVESFAAQAAEKEIRLEEAGEEQIPPVRADPDRVLLVLNNLIDNALRYTPKDGQVCVSAEVVGRAVHVSVKDTGEGIPDEFLDKVFDKFVQVKGKTTAGGSGLGLAIAREVVHAHGGAIWVETTPGIGSVFTFSLPQTG